MSYASLKRQFLDRLKGGVRLGLAFGVLGGGITTLFGDTNLSASSTGAPWQGTSLLSGFQSRIYAYESSLTNLVSLAFDDQGRCLVTETFRNRTSAFDIRDFPDWTDADYALRSVADRRDFLATRLVADSGLTDSPYRIDRDGNGVFDLRDLGFESEIVRRFTDRNRDGMADDDEVFAGGFNSAVSGVAGGVLPFGDSVWFSCVPDLWLLRDENQDGAVDRQEALHTGFGIHFSSSGHGLKGLAMGPDRRLYFSVGDQGARIEQDGRWLVDLPDTGAVFRCEPDGSQLTVLATGLRNPRELVFDTRGNLWVVDTMPKASGGSRLLYVVEGSDFGWHIGWERAPGQSVWSQELSEGVSEENDSAWILPPVQLVAGSPTGLAFNPGVGLPERFQDHFLLSAEKGGIQFLSVLPDGAGFTGAAPIANPLEDGFEPEEYPLEGEPAYLDVAFGPQGGFYVAERANFGQAGGEARIRHLFDEESVDSPQIAEVDRLLSEGVKDLSIGALGDLLRHKDRRIRLRAQFELVDRHRQSQSPVEKVIANALGQTPLVALREAVEKGGELPARLHGLWGLGEILSSDRILSAELTPYLKDPDPEIRAQTAKTLADRGVVGFRADYLSLMRDDDPRVQFYGAMWLGKTVQLGYHEIQAEENSSELVNIRDSAPIYELLRQNDDRDPWIRHAGVMALTRIDDNIDLEAAASDSSPAVRRAAVLALRRLKRPEIQVFLTDEDPQIVLEAARAIHDVPIEAAFPQLAELSRRERLPAEPVLRRSLNALYRLGKADSAAFLVAFVENDQAPEALRLEALDALSQWATPPKRDRVIGLWRASTERDKRLAVVPLRLALPNLLADPSPRIRRAVDQAARGLGMVVEGG